MTDKAEAAVRIYTGIEKRVLAGDLKALKEAAGSPERVNLLVEVYNCALPPDTPLTEDQQRFRNALVSVRDELNKQNKADTVSEVEALPPTLPYTRLVLERMREDRTAPPLNGPAERRAFLDEIEDTLSDEDLAALRDGNSGVLSPTISKPIRKFQTMHCARLWIGLSMLKNPKRILIGTAGRFIKSEVCRLVFLSRFWSLPFEK